jgi:uncharacterized protein YciI
MPYIVETFDKPDSLPLRMENRAEHLKYLDANKALLLSCGAKLHEDGSDLGGGLYVLDVDTREQAESFIEMDPFYKAGLFAEVRFTRWRKAYVAGVCHL